ncbi:MAG: hypothetical protein ABW250_22500 [Pyrinomonadaceae bacterium]
MATFKSFTLIILVLSCTLQVWAQESAVYAHMPDDHRQVVQKWLAKRPFYRLATEADADAEGLEVTRQYHGTLYHPYYKTGDFNNDGSDDFVVVLIDTRKHEGKHVIAIFNGQPNGESEPLPTYLKAADLDLTRGGLFYTGYGKGFRLAAGIFESDVCTGYKARGRTYVEAACGR